MTDRISRAEDEPRKGARARATGAHRARQSEAPTLDSGELWNAIRSPLRLQMLEAIATRPGVTARELAEALGASAPRLHYHLNIMSSAGLVRPLSGGSNGSTTGTSYEVARLPLLREGGQESGSPSDRVAALLVELTTAGVTAARESMRARPDGRSGSFAWCGHEALAPHELESIRTRLGEIDAILARAKARRRRARSLVSASAFIAICLASVEGTSLPDGLVGWGDPPAARQERIRSRSKGGV